MGCCVCLTPWLHAGGVGVARAGHTHHAHAVRRQRGCKAGVAARLFVWWVGTGALGVDNMPQVSHHHLHTDNAHHAPPRPHHRVCVDGPVCAPATPPRGHAHTTHTGCHGVVQHHHPLIITTHLHAWQHACGAAQSTGAAPPRQRACHANTVCGEAMVHHLTHKCSSAHLVPNNPTPWARRGSARVLPRQRRV